METLSGKAESEFPGLEKLEKPVANIFKNVWARVYLNVYGGDFTEDNGLTLKAALMEFFLPTTKRKQNWRRWLGAGSTPEVSVPKAAFIIFIDIVFFFPRLAINVAKLFTEVLPDTIAQLFLLANQKAKEGYEKNDGLSAFGYGLGVAVTGLFAGLFKFIYLIGCCITSPIATSIRARHFDYQNEILHLFSRSFSHWFAPATSFTCYLVILLLLANLIPGLGLVATVIGAALLGYMAAYVVIDHVLSCFNRNPNGDDLFEFGFLNVGADQLRYSDKDVNEKIAYDISNTEFSAGFKANYTKVNEEIKETLTYDSFHPFFRIEEVASEKNSSGTGTAPKNKPTVADVD